ncbi:hypothetical protein CMV_026188 [Castanea mollissima]|uniref:Uncharacterized protein n=1 Tax=Castanea mollissima TaxID=60419 RepID=A0A8J4VAN2_9ROSI|nr:hypothetical protein CMV_026188 [Castanea mollissima]
MMTVRKKLHSFPYMQLQVARALGPCESRPGSGRELVFLINSGSTHNFVDQKLTHSLGLAVTPITEFDVKVANRESVVYKESPTCRGAEEVNENRVGKLELQIVKQGLTFNNLLDREGDPNLGRDHDEAQLPGGEERRLVNRTDGELGLGLDEISHRLG